MKIVYNAKTKEIKREEFTPVQLTQEQLNKYRADEIKAELEELDKTVDRQWEDYYIREKITPFERIAIVIAKKEELRQELGDINE